MKRSLFVFLCALSLSLCAWSKTLVVLGDSLTEGYGVSREAAFPAVLEKKIKAIGKDWKVVNAGISGSTSASGAARLKWQLKSKPDLLILALGINDGLRGLKPAQMEKNLSETVELAQKEKLPIVLAGMMMPPNYTRSYAQEFNDVFPRIAKKYKLAFIPFLLKDVAGVASLNQSDGIHPNEKGHQIMAETVFEKIKDLL